MRILTQCALFVLLTFSIKCSVLLNTPIETQPTTAVTYCSSYLFLHRNQRLHRSVSTFSKIIRKNLVWGKLPQNSSLSSDTNNYTPPTTANHIFTNKKKEPQILRFLFLLIRVIQSLLLGRGRRLLLGRGRRSRGAGST